MQIAIRHHYFRTTLFLSLVLWLVSGCQSEEKSSLPYIQVAENPHFFQTSTGDPFFWLADTGWLLFIKCNREETQQYLDIRQKQGFNVIQVMVLHTLKAKNVYGDLALSEGNLARPIQTPGASPEDSTQYDYWDHVDFVITEAAKRGMYVALVPIWGSAAKDASVTVDAVRSYGKFLVEKLGQHSNIVWLNGGDILGDERSDVWMALGQTLKANDTRHLVTYHPRGRFSSTDWFHDQDWLDFNMIQSGHRTYAQDTSAKDIHHYGEDNWKYIAHDYQLDPIKPVLDGEPSYENIPHGLHDSLEARWTDADLRRYAYWSVFAGAAGFTYGENAIMQFHTKGDSDANFGVIDNWKESIHAPGAGQMQYLKELILERDYFSREPAQDILLANNGEKYDYLVATKGKGYALVYTYTGRPIQVNAEKLGFKPGKATWFHPADGQRSAATLTTDKTVLEFTPSGTPANGNDWVLILEQ